MPQRSPSEEEKLAKALKRCEWDAKDSPAGKPRASLWKQADGDASFLAYVAILGGGILVFVFVVMPLSRGHRKPTRIAGSQLGGQSSAVGETTSISSYCYGGASKSDYDRILQLAGAGDTEGVIMMVLTGRALDLTAGTKCRLIDAGPIAEVRILDGPHQFKSAFLMRRLVSRR